MKRAHNKLQFKDAAQPNFDKKRLKNDYSDYVQVDTEMKDLDNKTYLEGQERSLAELYKANKSLFDSIKDNDQFYEARDTKQAMTEHIDKEWVQDKLVLNLSCDSDFAIKLVTSKQPKQLISLSPNSVQTTKGIRKMQDIIN